MGLEQVFVGVEEDPPVAIDTRHPDREVRSLEPRSNTQLLRLLYRLVPDQQADVIPLKRRHVLAAPFNYEQITCQRDQSLDLVLCH